MILVPDTEQKKVYDAEIEPNLRPGQLLMFAHGFNIRFERIQPPATSTSRMVAPKGPGHLLRSVYQSGGGVPALFAVHHDAQRDGAYPHARLCPRHSARRAPACSRPPSREETETDLFGEQSLLCGGVSALIKAAFETLVEAGYQPELAYFETMHELKLIVDLMYRGGLNLHALQRQRHGRVRRLRVGPAHHRGRQDDHEGRPHRHPDAAHSRRAGSRRTRHGRPEFNRLRQADRNHQIEQVGGALRSQMAFLNPVEVDADAAQASTDSAPAPAAAGARA